MAAGGLQRRAPSIVGVVGGAVMAPRRSAVGIASTKGGPVPREVSATKEQDLILSSNWHRCSRHTTTSCAVIIDSAGAGAGDSECAQGLSKGTFTRGIQHTFPSFTLW